MKWMIAAMIPARAPIERTAVCPELPLPPESLSAMSPVEPPGFAVSPSTRTVTVDLVHGFVRIRDSYRDQQFSGGLTGNRFNRYLTGVSDDGDPVNVGDRESCTGGTGPCRCSCAVRIREPEQ